MNIILNLARKGKSAFLDYYAEQALEAGRRVLIIHPWGLEIKQRRRHLTSIERLPRRALSS